MTPASTRVPAAQHTIYVRVSEEEHRAMFTAAHANFMSMSSWARQVLRSAAALTAKRVPVLPTAAAAGGAARKLRKHRKQRKQGKRRAK